MKGKNYHYYMLYLEISLIIIALVPYGLGFRPIARACKGILRTNETLSNKDGEAFVSVGEKPSFLAMRVGRKSAS